MTQHIDIEFPADFFDPPDPRPDDWRDNIELRRAVDWFRSFVPLDKWVKRREDIARRLYRSALG